MMMALMAATSDLDSTCTSDLEAVETRSSLVVLPRRWTSVETVGRCLFFFSVAFFIAGILATVFGFSQLGLDLQQRLPLQVIGPTCLAVTGVMWVVGCLLSRLWHAELSRQKHMMELRDRVQLHALAVDSLLDSPVLSPAILQDPQLRRQLLLKLKAQRPTMRSRCSTDSTYDTSDTQHNGGEGLVARSNSFRKHLPDDGSADVTQISPGYSTRRSSKAAAILDAKRRMSTVSQITTADPERRESRDGAGPVSRRFQLPGIQISRFETLDRSSSISSSTAAASQRTSRRYILVHSGSEGEGLQGDKGGTAVLMSLPRGRGGGGGGEDGLARLSCPSDYSLSRSSRSRSSRASSAVSSRLWDFSPRSSEWEADISLGSRESQFSVGKQDWAGGPADCLGDDEDSSRKLSVVTFDIGSPSFRRHSSPTYPLKRRDSTASECTCQGLAQQPYRKRYSADIRLPPPTSIMKKYSVDQSIRSLRIDEDDGDIEEEDEDILNEDGETDRENKEYHAVGRSSRQSLPTSLPRLPCMVPESRSVGAARRDSSMSAPPTIDDRLHERRDRRRRSVRHNNTDDSQVEERVARLFREIELSLNESTDDSCYQVHKAACDDQESQFSPRGCCETCEAETQTIGSGEGVPAMRMPSDHVTITADEQTGSTSSLDSSGSQSDFTYSNSSVGGYRPLANSDRDTIIRTKWARFAAFARALVTMRSSPRHRQQQQQGGAVLTSVSILGTPLSNRGKSKRYLTVRKTSVKPGSVL